MYLVIIPLDVGDIHVVGGGAHIFILLVGEDVDSNQVHLRDDTLCLSLRAQTPGFMWSKKCQVLFSSRSVVFCVKPCYNDAVRDRRLNIAEFVGFKFNAINMTCP